MHKINSKLKCLRHEKYEIEQPLEEGRTNCEVDRYPYYVLHKYILYAKGKCYPMPITKPQKHGNHLEDSGKYAYHLVLLS